MTINTYHNWRVSANSIIGYGGKQKQYVHYCPKSDFLEIVNIIVDVANKNGIVTRPDVMFQWLNSKSKEKPFKEESHRYKLGMVFQYLSDKKLIKFKKVIKKSLYTDKRGIFSYTLTQKGNEIIDKISKIWS